MYRLVTVITLSSALIACSANDPNKRAKTGAAVGAVVGAVVGKQAGDDNKDVAIGAAVGAVAGAAVGHYMDKQQQEFEQAMEEERRRNELEIERMKDDTLKLSLDSEVSFDFNQAAIKPTFRPTLDKLANVLNKYNRTVVHVIGHTDSIGSDSYNQRLSERRASSTADYLMAQGVPADRIRTEGRGESQPRASNASEAGRQLNRRVEIYIKPIVEGQEQRAYIPPA